MASHKIGSSLCCGHCTACVGLTPSKSWRSSGSTPIRPSSRPAIDTIQAMFALKTVLATVQDRTFDADFSKDLHRAHIENAGCGMLLRRGIAYRPRRPGCQDVQELTPACIPSDPRR